MKYIEGSIPFDENGNYKLWSRHDGWVTLTKERWEHSLARHPESDLEMNWQKISDTLQNPDSAVPEGDTRVYYRKFATRTAWNIPNLPNAPSLQYFTVIIQVVDKFIVTIYEQEDVKKRHESEDDKNV